LGFVRLLILLGFVLLPFLLLILLLLVLLLVVFFLVLFIVFFIVLLVVFFVVFVLLLLLLFYFFQFLLHHFEIDLVIVVFGVELEGALVTGHRLLPILLFLLRFSCLFAEAILRIAEIVIRSLLQREILAQESPLQIFLGFFVVFSLKGRGAGVETQARV